MRREQFVNGEIYHIVIKGNEGMGIFKNIDDYYRAIFSIYEFNDAKPVIIREKRKARLKLKEEIKKVNQKFKEILDESNRESNRDLVSVDLREKWVEILAFCIMPNHLHLLLRQIKEGGITKFMLKLGAGYGGYFNRKYGHEGHVFHKTFTAVHIENEDQLRVVFVYIHTNPISLIEPNWKEMGIQNPGKAIEFVKNYKWLSYPDYIGKKNFPSVTDREFVLKIMGGETGCKEFVESWIKYKGEIREYANLALE